MILTEFSIDYHTHILIWLIVIAIVVIIEATLKKHLIGLWFAIGGIVGLLFALLQLNFIVQLVGFLVISIVFTIINELYFRKKNNNDNENECS